MHVAIVGSGPSGFYAAEALLRSERAVAIDLIERLPTPFGLVRGGVAPDHVKTKKISASFDRIARSPTLRFLGNVHVGIDVSTTELRELYDVVIMACGAGVSRPMGVPGEHLPGVYDAAAFVGWYNGHPDYRSLSVDLSHERALVIGHGNVAIDVARILVSPLERLAATDMPMHAVDVLAQSKVREVWLIGRRGPAQARFSNAELRELGTIPGCDVIVDRAAMDLDPTSVAEIQSRDNEVCARNVEILREFYMRPRSGTRCIHMTFLSAPVEFIGATHVEKARLQQMRLHGQPNRQSALPAGESTKDIHCGLVVASTGYRTAKLSGLPLDEERGIFPNDRGRILMNGAPVPGAYVVGWAKRGPSGVIGTNRADSAATVEAILDDWPILPTRSLAPHGSLDRLLEDRGVQVVTFADWARIDQAELERGRQRGKLREKFTSIEEFLQIASATS